MEDLETLVAGSLGIITTSLTTWGLQVVGAFAILIGGYMVSGWVQRRLRRWSSKDDRIDPTIRPLILQLVRGGIMAVAVIAVLNNFGVQTASVVALLGAAGLAIGLALQGTLANVASGVMLLTLRPLAVGESVEVGGNLGTVMEIGLFATTLKGFDGVICFYPNSSVWGSTIKNFSRNGLRRFEVGIGIAYQADIDRAFTLVHDVLDKDERILKDPAPAVFVGNLADSSVDLVVRGWCSAADAIPTGNDMRRLIKQRFDRDGISIPFPQREVRILKDA